MLPPASDADDVVIGIDPNVYTGMTVLKGGSVQATKLITFPDKKGINRVHSLAIGVGSVIDEWRPRFVFVEGYGYGNKFTLVSCVEIGSAIRMELYRRQVPWFDVQPSALKKWTTLNGRAKKPEMGEAVKKRWNFTSESDDVIDSFALAMYGWTWLRSPTNQLLLKHGG